MQRSDARLPVILALLGALATAGCRGGEGSAAADPAAIDTMNRDQLDGLSTQQVQQQATPMTPEQAQQLGIVDTTIHVEQLASESDSALARGAPAPPPAPAVPDTARRDSTP